MTIFLVNKSNNLITYAYGSERGINRDLSLFNVRVIDSDFVYKTPKIRYEVKHNEDGFPIVNPNFSGISNGNTPVTDLYLCNEYTRIFPEIGDEDPISNASDDNIRKMKHNEFKFYFDTAILNGFTTTSLTTNFKVDVDFDSINKLNSLKNLASIAGLTTVEIRDYDNVSRQLSISDFDKLLIDIGSYVQNLFTKKNTLQDQAKTATIKNVLKLTW